MNIIMNVCHKINCILMEDTPLAENMCVDMCYSTLIISYLS